MFPSLVLKTILPVRYQFCLFFCHLPYEETEAQRSGERAQLESGAASVWTRPLNLNLVAPPTPQLRLQDLFTCVCHSPAQGGVSPNTSMSEMEIKGAREEKRPSLWLGWLDRSPDHPLHLPGWSTTGGLNCSVTSAQFPFAWSPQTPSQDNVFKCIKRNLLIIWKIGKQGERI